MALDPLNWHPKMPVSERVSLSVCTRRAEWPRWGGGGVVRFPESESFLCSLSCVQLLVTSWTVAFQAPLSMGFPRQEYWSGNNGVTISSSRGSSQPRDQSCISGVSCVSRQVCYHCLAPGKPLLPPRIRCMTPSKLYILSIPQSSNLLSINL